MSPRDVISGLAARGVVLIANGDRIIFDAPQGALTDCDISELRARKAAILDALRIACRVCGQPRDQQDARSWWCASCRRWSDAAGDPLQAAT